MLELKLPKSVRDIDAAWLTQALRQGGAPPETRVDHVETETIGEGAGFAGELGRLTVSYAAGSPSGPPTLIAKAPTAAAETRAFFQLAGFYAIEAGFYRDMAARVPLRTPRCHFNGGDLATGNFLLLLEDLAPARVGDQVTACSDVDCDLAVDRLAGLHAAFWGKPELEVIDWLRPIDHPERTGFFQLVLPAVWPAVVEKARDYIGEKVRRIGAMLPAELPALAAILGKTPVTLLHGDYRLDNLMFGVDGGESLAVLDWQATSRGRGAADLAYFIVGNLTVEDRRRRQDQIISSYLRGLKAGGVEGYGLDECWRDTRAAALLQLGVLALLLSGAPDLGGLDRGAALARTSLERTNAFFEDTDFQDLQE